MFEVKYLKNEQGDTTDVVIPYADYLELLEELEDTKDIIERENDELIEHDKVKEMLLDNDV
jgi:hypothetical protein